MLNAWCECLLLIAFLFSPGFPSHNADKTATRPQRAPLQGKLSSTAFSRLASAALAHSYSNPTYFRPRKDSRAMLCSFSEICLCHYKRQTGTSKTVTQRNHGPECDRNSKRM
jgi:hypothetical protein